jgi:plasmid stabilization system protein ParE
MIGHFILSKASQEDLQEIYDYSINVFGINQAITYLEG